MIRKSGMRPNIVVNSQSTKQLIMIELTVPYENRMEATQTYKTENYSDLANHLRRQGYQVKILAVEVGARGFVGESAYNLMKQLSIAGREKTQSSESHGRSG